MSATAETVAAPAGAAPNSSTSTTTTKKGASSKKTGTTKKPVNAKTKTAGKPRATTSKTVKAAAAGRPSWKNIIKECIAANKEDTRQGVSRTTIKKFAEEKYKLEVTGVNLSQLNRAIASGAEGGLFVLPKGLSGKVKLAPKVKASGSGSKENSKPPSKNKALAKAGMVKKAAVPKSTGKKESGAAPKKTLAGKAKTTALMKKMTVGAKRDTAKKAVTGTTAAAKAKAAGRATTKKELK